jgi:hypothetical protein
MNRTKFPISNWQLAIVFILLLAVAAPAAPPQLSIWCEFMPYKDVEATLPVLARYDCDLLLHVGREDIGNSDLVALCRAARSHGVNVAAWFLLPYDEHLYVGEATADPIRDFSLKFVEWSQKETLGIDWVVFDCEPSPLLGKKLFYEVRRGRVIALARILRAETEPAQFSESVDKLNNLIDELHGRGVKVMGAANRVFLDFLRHGNTAVQDSLNAPFSMVRWDRASFITYRYKASQVQYVGMVNRYGTLAHLYFDEKAALDLGLLGDQRDFPEHRERAELFAGGDYFMSYLNEIGLRFGGGGWRRARLWRDADQFVFAGWRRRFRRRPRLLAPRRVRSAAAHGPRPLDARRIRKDGLHGLAVGRLVPFRRRRGVQFYFGL